MTNAELIAAMQGVLAEAVDDGLDSIAESITYAHLLVERLEEADKDRLRLVEYARHKGGCSMQGTLYHPTCTCGFTALVLSRTISDTRA